MKIHALNTRLFLRRIRRTCAMVATMVSFRATLTHGNVAKERPLENRRRATEPTMDTIRPIFFVLPFLILNAGCEVGDINITTSESYDADDSSDAGTSSSSNTSETGTSGDISTTVSTDDDGTASGDASTTSSSTTVEDETGCQATDDGSGDLPACTPCEVASQCEVGFDCICASAFGPGICLPEEWDECSAPPCDESCFYVDGAWICGIAGC